MINKLYKSSVKMPKTIHKCPFENCGKDCINTYCFRHQKIMGAEYPKFKIRDELYYITERNCDPVGFGCDDTITELCDFGNVERYFGKNFHLVVISKNNTHNYYHSKYSYINIYLDDKKCFREVCIALVEKSYEKDGNSLFPLKFKIETVRESKYFKGEAGRQIVIIEPKIQE